MNLVDILISLALLSVLTFALARQLAAVLGIRNLWRIEAKLDLLLKQAGVEFDPYTSLPRDAADALQRGKKIEAIAVSRFRQSRPEHSQDGR